MRNKLIRTVNGNRRYYEINVSPTLFGDFCVERIYGSVRNRSYTGLTKSYFDTFSEAILFYKKILHAKLSKGYQFS
jgi:predicted DNA-binding WGR domain protein